MPVNSTTKQYEDLKTKWERCRDCFEGQDAIYAGGEKYLPRLEGQDDEQYKSYLKRTRFFNAFRRTVEAMVGLVMRKPPIVDDDSGLLDDVTGDGCSITEYIASLLNERLQVGKAGTLLDFPKMQEGLTAAEAEALNARPVFVGYKAEQIINWRYTTENNTRKLTMVVLEETVEEAVDEFETEDKVQYRVLELVDGKYQQRLFVDDVETEVIVPRINGSQFDRIPFIIHEEKLPPLLDLADTAIKHFQLNADYYYGLHLVALPTPYVTGVDKDSAPTTIGPAELWVLENPDSEAGFLEFEGSGLSQIKDELERTEKTMSQIGARLLDNSDRNVATATEATIDNMNSNATLIDMVRKTDDELNELIAKMMEWAGAGESVITINTDFNPVPMEANEIVALVSAWQNGAISKEQLFNKLQKGEVVSPELSFEDHEDQIDANKPPISQGGGFE